MAKLPQGVKRRENGTLEKRISINGKRYSIYGKTIKEVNKKEQEKRIQLANDEQAVENPVLNDFYKMFTDDRRERVKPSTLRSQQHQYRMCSEIEITPNKSFGEMRLGDIQKKHIKILQRKLAQDTKLSNGSVNHYMAHLKHVFNRAINDEYIEKNPCNGIERLIEKDPTEPKLNHRCLTQEEIKIFFDAAQNSFYYNFFVVMVQTGVRIGELSALRHSDINFKDKTITINKTVTRDEIGNYLVGESAKTKKGNRTVPMNEIVSRSVADQMKKNKLYYDVQKIDDLVFKSPLGNILREYQINREIARICKRIDIDCFTCHCFRHTFASYFIKSKPHDFKILSEILGHSSTKITLDLYTHVLAEDKKKSMESFGIAL